MDKNVEDEAMAKILLQKSISNKKISIAANYPIMTLLMNRNDKSEENSDSDQNIASHSEIESLQIELENLLTDAGVRYMNLQALLRPSDKNKPVQKISQKLKNPEKDSNSKETAFYHLAKPVSFTEIDKRAKFLREMSKSKSNASLSPIDKNRNEHLERFWSAVEDFVGSIPQETLEFFLKTIVKP